METMLCVDGAGKWPETPVTYTDTSVPSDLRGRELSPRHTHTKAQAVNDHEPVFLNVTFNNYFQ